MLLTLALQHALSSCAASSIPPLRRSGLPVSQLPRVSHGAPGHAVRPVRLCALGERLMGNKAKEANEGWPSRSTPTMHVAHQGSPSGPSPVLLHHVRDALRFPHKAMVANSALEASSSKFISSNVVLPSPLFPSASLYSFYLRLFLSTHSRCFFSFASYIRFLPRSRIPGSPALYSFSESYRLNRPTP